MSDGLSYLAPIILTCGTIGCGMLALAAWKGRRWPEPQAYKTKFGVLVRRK